MTGVWEEKAAISHTASPPSLNQPPRPVSFSPHSFIRSESVRASQRFTHKPLQPFLGSGSYFQRFIFWDRKGEEGEEKRAKEVGEREVGSMRDRGIDGR